MRTITVGDAVLRVMYAGVSPFEPRFKTQIYYDGRTIAEIATALDGNSGIEYTDGDSKETFTGYPTLTEIARVDGETVVAVLKEVNE